jgi:hypothetical protein
MLAKSVTFVPQLRATLASARSPRPDRAYRGKSVRVGAHLVLKNTSPLASIPASLQPPDPPQELTPVWQRGRRALFEICFQQLPCAPVQLALGAWTLLRSQRPPLALRRHVTLDRGDTYTEGLGGLDPGHPPLYGFHDLFTQIF